MMRRKPPLPPASTPLVEKSWVQLAAEEDDDTPTLLVLELMQNVINGMHCWYNKAYIRMMMNYTWCSFFQDLLVPHKRRAVKRVCAESLLLWLSSA
jgi:hypothetical protein